MEFDLLKGKEGEIQEAEFCERDLLKFLEAIGEDNALYKKEKILPPTFFTIMRKGRQDHGIKSKVMLHGSQEYEIKRLPKLGEKISYKTKIKDIYEKEGKKGKMLFVVYESEYHSGEEIIGVGRSILIFM